MHLKQDPARGAEASFNSIFLPREPLKPYTGVSSSSDARGSCIPEFLPSAARAEAVYFGICPQRLPLETDTEIFTPN